MLFNRRSVAHDEKKTADSCGKSDLWEIQQYSNTAITKHQWTWGKAEAANTLLHRPFWRYILMSTNMFLAVEQASSHGVCLLLIRGHQRNKLAETAIMKRAISKYSIVMLIIGSVASRYRRRHISCRTCSSNVFWSFHPLSFCDGCTESIET